MKTRSPQPAAGGGSTQTTGRLARARAWLFGERDAIEEQISDLARQGVVMARLAHLAAFLMIVLFSAGSLVTLSGDAVAAVVRGWSAGTVNVPQAISVAVSGLLVLCLDTGMLLAASTLRVLRSRRAGWGERWVHVAIMCGVALVEASTYALMSVTYDRPHSLAAWAIILARALSAPILSVYLALAQPLPVTSRDILAQVELASGKGVLRDVVRIAHDGEASLGRKMSLFDASAVMAEHDRARLTRLVAVAQEDAREGGQAGAESSVDAAHTATVRARDGRGETPETPETPEEPPQRPRPPTGPGSPQLARTGSASSASSAPDEIGLHIVPTPRVRGRDDDEPPEPAAQPAARRGQAKTRRAHATAADRRAAKTNATRERREGWLEHWLAEDPAISTRELTRKLRNVEHKRVSESTVAGLRRVVETRRDASQAAQ